MKLREKLAALAELRAERDRLFADIKARSAALDVEMPQFETRGLEFTVNGASLIGRSREPRIDVVLRPPGSFEALPVELSQETARELGAWLTKVAEEMA